MWTMTDCPRCQDRLAEFSSDRSSVQACTACGYVGIPADFHSSVVTPEPWETALERFRKRK